MNLDAWEAKLRRFEILDLREMLALLRAATDVLMEENNVPNIALPVTISGDIHGQYLDLLHLFEIAGELGNSAGCSNYIFLGDMVDRGYNSVEVLTFLLILKLKYSDKVTLLRGNHETRQVTMVYGFYDECNRKYASTDVWRLCTELFDCLPIAGLVDRRVLCIHGGLSPDIYSVDHIRILSRFQEIPMFGPFTDMVWSDPDNVQGWVMSQRGAGFLFGAAVTREFMFRNKLDLIARAHQLVQEGFRYHFNEEFICTIWSAPNYCYRCNNLASVLRIYEDDDREMVVFKEADVQIVNDDEPAKRIQPSYFL